MNLIEDESMLVVRYLKSKKQVTIPDDVRSVESFAGFEPVLSVMTPTYEPDSPDGPGYETSVFVYKPEEGVNWGDGVKLYEKNKNPDVPTFAVQLTVKDVKSIGLEVASQPFEDGSPHASIRGFSDDDKLREDQSDSLAVASRCIIRPDQEEKQKERAYQILRQRETSANKIAST